MNLGVGCLILGLALFVLGLVQALSTRKFLGYLFGIELMLNAANINLLGFLQTQPDRLELSVLMLFIIAYAAIETAVALAIFTWTTKVGQSIQSPFGGI